MIPITVLFESPALLAVDKPAGITVIPGRDAESAASLKAQLEKTRRERLWVVHRLDRDTSGVLLLARTAEAHRTLSMAFEAGTVEKVYWALCVGTFRGDRTVDLPLLPARRSRMRPVREGEPGGKEARTELKSLETFGARATWIEARPQTGRTHQIRVHLLALGHPLLLDHQYGRKSPLAAADLGGQGDEVLLSRTPLHAAQLALRGLEGIHDVVVSAPMPDDMKRSLDVLRESAAPR